MLDEELATIFESISEIMLNAQLTVLAGPEPEFDQGACTASIALHGGFEGVLYATFGKPLARLVTGVLYGRVLEVPSPEDVHDALGELVNIAAGNLKGVLPASCQLSLPRVQSGRPSLDGPGEHAIGKGHYQLMSESLTVLLTRLPTRHQPR